MPIQKEKVLGYSAKDLVDLRCEPPQKTVDWK